MLRKIIALLAVLVIAVLFSFNSIAAAGLVPLSSDPSAMIEWANSTTFSVADGGYNFDGSVDYAVYAPDNYGGTVVFPNNHYVYAYQFFNDSTSNVSVDTFSVGLSPDAVVANEGTDTSYGVPGGIDTGMEFILLESVLYMFIPAGVASGRHSAVLLFSGESEPTWGCGIVSGGITGGAIVDLPTPIPEPATVALIGICGLIIVTRKRKMGAER